LAGCHGGLYRLPTPSAASSTTNYWLSEDGNLGISEINSVAYDDVSHVLFAGFQDNGSASQSAKGSTTWTKNLGFGDGQFVAVDDTTLAASPVVGTPASTTLASAIGSTDTILPVASTAGFPSANFYITVDSEQIFVTGTATGSTATAQVSTTTEDKFGTVTATTAAAHGFTVGQYVTVSGVTVTQGLNTYNGTFLITSVPSSTTFTYSPSSDFLSGSDGSGGTATGVPAFTVVRGVNGTTAAAHDSGATATNQGRPQALSIRYASAQNLGGFARSIFDSNNNLLVSTPISKSAITDVQFGTPLVLNAVDPKRLLIGGSGHLYESTDQGNSFTSIANVGANSFSGLPLAYGGYKNGVALPNVLYVGSGSTVYLRTTAGGAVTATTALPGTPGRVKNIVMNPADAANVFVTDSFDHVYQSTDAGKTWTDVTGNLLSSGLSSSGFTALAFVPGSAPYIAVGSRNGVFASTISSLGTWVRLGTGLATAPVFSLVYDKADDVLAAGTLGRGAWLLSSASSVLVTTPVASLQSSPAAAVPSSPSAPPTASVSGPDTALASQLVTFDLSATSPSLADQNAGFTYSIDWGDGSTQTIDPSIGNGSAVADHAYDATGSYTIQVTATDQEGGVSPVASTTIQVNDLTAASLQALIATTPIVNLEPVSDAALQNDMAAINGLTSPSSPVALTVILGSGPYSDITASPPSGVTLDLAGGQDGVTSRVEGQASALTVTSGEVFAEGLDLVAIAEAPTVTVTGGHATLNSDQVDEGGFDEPAMDVTGGHLSLGPNVTVDVLSHDDFISSYAPGAVGPETSADNPTGVDNDLTPDIFEMNGQPVTAFAMDDMTLTSSEATSTVGLAVTFTATVNHDPNDGTPTGTVDFYDGETFLGSGPLQTIGDVTTATFTTSTLGPGAHDITAFYDGDANFLSSSETLTQNVESGFSITGSVFQDLTHNGFSSDDPKLNTADPFFTPFTVNLYLNGGTSPYRTTTTDTNGDYIFAGLSAGKYHVTEVAPSGWVLTGKQGAIATRTVQVTANSTGNNFDDYRKLSRTGTAQDKSYWAHKGNSSIQQSWLQELDTLNLRNEDGSLFSFLYDPNGTLTSDQLATDQKELADFLRGATETDIANALSAQLAVTELNVLAGFVKPDTYVYVGGIDTGSNLTGPFSRLTTYYNGFVQAQDLIDAAAIALYDHGTALSGDAWLPYFQTLHDVFHAINSDRSIFVL
jgi:hypothetical protein